ncbi:hypothetical protein A8139_07545 [Marinomonas primoryensis]|uniref:Serine aminopeptidase S33 domain-containing protein n=1 Tax=Marinomonas primoryensis TaxID=178399 RepID=A0A2Z4PQZ7_9GAMM|nr:alpha/beta hydrolase [Marinomonas primoryensis]AWX99864.1 hypothetical protein A8139_07545 [Marinomonas primoryensis]
MKIFIFLLSFFIISASYAEEVFFKYRMHNLSGHYLDSTDGSAAKAILIFVHGDGPMNYDAEGYYRIIWEPLRKKGYAIFSWNKPGIAGSGGNWLNQTMGDRQAEVLAAIDFVQSQYGFSRQKIGLVGFSQAGWVLPALAGKQSKVGFMIGIGFAKNWVEQGAYHTKVRLKLEGKNQNEINLALDLNSKEIAFFTKNPSYLEYKNYIGKDPMTKERYEFVLKNFTADASSDYKNINVPSLFIWGEQDKNVNAIQEFSNLKLNNNDLITTKLIENASHGMLDSYLFDGQNLGFIQWVRLMWLKKDAFSPDFIPTIAVWLEERNQ